MSRGNKATDSNHDTESRRQYLKIAMTRQHVTAQILSDRTGISKRTIEGYTSGRYDLADAAGISVTKISMVMNLKVFALGGARKVTPEMLATISSKSTDADILNEPRPLAVMEEFKWAMKVRQYNVAKLSEKSGVEMRVIYEMLEGKRNICKMAAATVFTLCRTMTYHPYFLYQFRQRTEYRKYYDNIQNKRKKHLIRREVFTTAQDEYHKRLEADGFEIDEEDWFL